MSRSWCRFSANNVLAAGEENNLLFFIVILVISSDNQGEVVVVIIKHQRIDSLSLLAIVFDILILCWSRRRLWGTFDWMERVQSLISYLSLIVGLLLFFLFLFLLFLLLVLFLFLFVSFSISFLLLARENAAFLQQLSTV